MNVRRSVFAFLVVIIIAGAAPEADSVRIDVERSKLTVFVYKSGLFSAFADDHVIQASIASGSMSLDAPLAVEIAVKSATRVCTRSAH